MEDSSKRIKKASDSATCYKRFVFVDRDYFLGLIQKIYICFTLFYCNDGVLCKWNRCTVFNA